MAKISAKVAEDLIPVKMVAEILEISGSQARWLISNKTLNGFDIGGRLFARRSEVDEYKAKIESGEVARRSKGSDVKIEGRLSVAQAAEFLQVTYPRAAKLVHDGKLGEPLSIGRFLYVPEATVKAYKQNRDAKLKTSESNGGVYFKEYIPVLLWREFSSIMKQTGMSHQDWLTEKMREEIELHKKSSLKKTAKKAAIKY